MSDIENTEQIITQVNHDSTESVVESPVNDDSSITTTDTTTPTGGDEDSDSWELFDGSGYVSQLPNNPQWPVVERYIYPLPPTPQYADPEQCLELNQETSSLKDAPRVVLVTGSSGIVGRRLVTMLIQRGSEKVIALDLDEVTEDIRNEHITILGEHMATNAIEYVQGSIDDIELVTRLLQGVDCIINCAAKVGPYHSTEAYNLTNYQSLHKLLEGARIHNVQRFVHVSIPQTRVDPEHDSVHNLSESELPELLSFEYKNDYVYSRAAGEKVVLESNGPDLRTVVISPHQVYSPNDHVFLPSFVHGALMSDLRVMGKGDNLVSMTHVDNCCHALILAAAKLEAPDSPIAGQTFFVSDGGAQYFWGVIDDIIVRAGLPSLKTKVRAPSWIVSPFSYFMSFIDKHTKLNPFIVHMITKNRYFNIQKSVEELGYFPIRSFTEAWIETCEAILTRLELPCYNTRFYFEGVQFDGMRAEISKIEKAEREELARQRKEEAEERFRQQQLAQEHATEEGEEEEAPVAAAAVDESTEGEETSPVAVAAPVPTVVDEVEPQQEQQPEEHVQESQEETPAPAAEPEEEPEQPSAGDDDDAEIEEQQEEVEESGNNNNANQNQKKKGKKRR